MNNININLKELKKIINNTYRVKYKFQFLNIPSKDIFTGDILCSLHNIPENKINSFVRKKIEEHQNPYGHKNFHIIEESIKVVELSEEEKNQYYEYYSKLT